MNRLWLMPATILTGICALSFSSFAQTYTVSAKPGALNFIEGDVTLNGDPVWTSNLKSTFLNANDVLAVNKGKAEVLLTPGVFLRVGENSQVRMIKPSLIETQLEVVAGENLIEVDDLVPGSSIAVMDHGSSTTLIKPGLYRFTEHSIAVLDGRAEVAVGEHKIDLRKNKEVEIGDTLLTTKVDLSQGDDLYAWSNVRAQYNAAATYAGSRQAYDSGGYGFSSFSSPGWYWSSPFNSYMWLPGNGAFYSPFGWGFYGPGVVYYAPVISLPYYGTPVVKGSPTSSATVAGVSKPPVLNVPINPRNTGVANFTGTSPAAFAAARLEMQQLVAFYGLRTASGAPAAELRSGQTFANIRSASRAAEASARASSSSAPSSGASSASSGWASSSRSSSSMGGAVSHASSGGRSR